MNATFYKNSHARDRQVIESITENLSHKKFHQAEDLLLGLLEDMTNREYNTLDDCNKALSVVKLLYYGYNDYLAEVAPGSETSLKTVAHSNILIAHCTDPESMDDLIYEVMLYLKDFESDEHHDEATRHLDCYRSQTHLWG